MVANHVTVSDISDPSAPVVLDDQATLRLTVDDNGEPGIFVDAVGITVWQETGALWFSSNWYGGRTENQTIAGGNIQVR